MRHIDRAKELSHEGHKYQMYGVYPYSYHINGVVAKVKDLYINDKNLEQLTILAYLHDLKEDNPEFISYEELSQLFGEELVVALKLITYNGKMSKMDYIKLLSNNELALKVKVADMMFNLSESLKNPRDNLYRISKYTKQLNYLVNKLRIENYK